MWVEHRTDGADVVMGREVNSVADVDRELLAAVELRDFARHGYGRRHPSAPRHAANLSGLIDVLLQARVELAEAEVCRGVDPDGYWPSWGVAS